MPGSGNKPKAHCTLICFNFHTRTSRPSLAPPLLRPSGLKTVTGGGSLAVVSLVRGLAVLLGDVIHVSLQGAKFDASRNTVTASRTFCKSEVIHAVGYFSSQLATQVWNAPPKKKERKKRKRKNTTFRHALPSRCNATLAVIWGLFVIFSGALSGRRTDISESAQKPPEWCHAQLMSPGSNSISLMNSSHSGGMLMVEVPWGIKGRNAANAPTLPFDLTSVYLHLTYSPPPPPPPPVTLARRAVKQARRAVKRASRLQRVRARPPSLSRRMHYVRTRRARDQKGPVWLCHSDNQVERLKNSQDY